MRNPDPDIENLNILIDTSPLQTAHSTRGIGTYTRLLTRELEKIKGLNVRWSTKSYQKTSKPSLTHFPFFDLFFSTLRIKFFHPVVVTIHDVIPLKYPEYYPVGVKGKLRLIWQKFALKFVKAVITDSYSSKKDIINHLGVPGRKIKVVYLAANENLENQEEKEIRKVRRQFGLPQKYFLYVGDINYNKNIPQLIKILKFLPKDVHLVCVGKNFYQQNIPEWQWIETQIALSSVGDRVHFLTEVLTEQVGELAAIYSGAICYVQPSLDEGFGLPVLEAMRCRVPVVSSNRGSLPEVGGKYSLYAKPNAETMAEKIEEITTWSKSYRTQFTREAYAWSQNFSWKKAAEQTTEVYKSVTGHR